MDRGACPCSPWGDRQGQGRSPCQGSPPCQGSLAGYSPKGHEELDTTEQLNTHTKSDDLHAITVTLSQELNKCLTLQTQRPLPLPASSIWGRIMDVGDAVKPSNWAGTSDCLVPPFPIENVVS